MLPGNLRESLGRYVEGWDGPEAVEGFEGTDGSIRKVRSEWSRADGKRRRIEVRYLASSIKVILTPLPARSSEGEGAQ